MFTKLIALTVCFASTVSAFSLHLPFPPLSRPGFVTTRGSKFYLNGRPFHFAGTNSYWAQFTTNTDDIAHILERAAGAGLKVIRTWGFQDVNETFIPPEAGGLPRYNIDSAQQGQAIIYQTWKDGKATINTGPNGLQHFDRLVRIAEQKGIKLIVSLTNNWADYGGMDVYTINLGGKYHDEFFYNPKVIAAYKNYVRTIVTRYRNSPAIFAWELGNEPRCGADATRNLPRSPDGCSPAVVTKWADEMSTFIKSLDRYHLVTLGDEGFFNDPSDTSGDWAYNGADGVDFVGNLKLKNLDFGTFHLYPDWWSKTPEWANQFVRDHAKAQREARKPVVFEEYGWLSVKGRMDNFGTVSNYTRLQVVGAWQKIAEEEKLAGDMYWQFGLQTGLSTGVSTDDGFTIFLENTTESDMLIHEHVAAMNRLNR